MYNLNHNKMDQGLFKTERQAMLAEMTVDELFAELGDAEVDWINTDNYHLINYIHSVEKELKRRHYTDDEIKDIEMWGALLVKHHPLGGLFGEISEGMESYYIAELKRNSQ